MVPEAKEIVVAERLVEEAVVAKEEVVVALVEVEFWAVKFWRVEEPERRRLVKEAETRLRMSAVKREM